MAPARDGAEVAVQQRENVAAGPQGHRQADGRGLIAEAQGNGAFDVSLLKQLQQPVFQTAGEEHQGIRHLIEGFSP